jgi:DNA-binding CsgD family transcriptional regulator/Tfp pilus assembly protein PilF
MVPHNTPLVSPLLIGRESELDRLVHALNVTQQGTGRCILVAGEAGIGKSRLLAELRRRALHEQFTSLEGHCFEQDVGFPYAPWIDALRAYFEQYSASEINAQLGPLASEFVKLLPELSLLLPQVQPSPPLEPEAEKRRHFETAARFVANLSTAHPVLIVLEDLHWSDELSLELLHVLTRRIAHLPILLIGTFRTEERSARLSQHVPDLSRAPLAEEIRLTPLARDHVEQMTRALLQSEMAVGDSLLDALNHLTEGNPFYVEEMLKSLIEAGSIAERFGRWELQSGHKLEIPHNIQDAVQWRVERLSENARRIVTFAAVAGQHFDVELLQAVTKQAEQPLLQTLKELINAQLIVEQSSEQFAFRHALIREAVYAMPLLRERQAMHRHVGETMERLWGTMSDAHNAELAYHFDQAAVWDKALAYSQRAGEQAQRQHAPREALGLFSRALAAADRLNTTPPWSIPSGRAHALELLGEFEPARADYERALELAGLAKDSRAEWATLIDLGFLWQSRDWVRAGDYFKRAFELARSLEEPALIAQTLKRLGHWHLHGGQLREAQSDHQQALELFKQLNDRRGMAQTLELLGLDSYNLGEVVQGAAYLERAVPILRELDDRQGVVNALRNLGLRPRFDTEVIGELDLHQLANLGETALQIARSCVYRVGEAVALEEVGVCLCQAGEYGRGLEYLRRALSIAEEIEHRELLWGVHIAWGSDFYLGLLAVAEAREHLEAARAAAHERGAVPLEFVAIARLVTAYILQNDLTQAQVLLGAVLPDDLPNVTLMTFLLRSCWAARAELELALGKPERALQIIEHLLASTANLAQYGPHAVPRLSQLRGQALAGLRRNEEAIAELQGALHVAEAQGRRSMLWRLHADLGNAYRALGRRAESEQEFLAARMIVRQLADTVPDEALREHFLTEALAIMPTPLALTPRQAAAKEFGGLSERERQVAALIAQGKSNREIAEMLVITVRTVEAHITRILDKLDFKSRSEIAAWTVAKGLVHPRQ